jgi:hypothetical protein
LAHCSDTDLSPVPDCSNTKVTIPTITDDICPGCALGKQNQKPFKPNSKRATRIGELTHSDLLKMPILSYSKYKWILTFLDDYSSTCTIVLLQNKAEAARYIEVYVIKMKTANGVDCWSFRTNNGSEYMSKGLAQFFTDRGIDHQTMALYAHQQNGHAERLNCTLLEKAQAMQLHACLPDGYWEFTG